MARNGGAQETWHLIRNTVSVMPTRANPVQESMWKFHPTPPIILTNLSSFQLILIKDQALNRQQWLLLRHMTKQACFEWFMRGGNTSNTTSTVSTSSRQQLRQQQVMQIASSSPPRFELDKDNTDHNKNASSYNQPQNYDDDKQGFYIPDTSNLQMSENHHHQEMDSSHRTQTTRHFFTDAWDKDIGFDVGINRKGLSASLSKKFSPSALSLSMSGGGSNSGIGHEDDDEDGYLGIGVTDSTVSWMNTISLPGGPLGEALCLGNPSATRGGKSASPHGYSNSNTNSSTCSKSSCDDGSRALNFIG
ncbi:hypothetical protein OROHE_003682 [Orobanche hederae]